VRVTGFRLQRRRKRKEKEMEICCFGHRKFSMSVMLLRKRKGQLNGKTARYERLWPHK
jgi:hypothetical protein